VPFRISAVTKSAIPEIVAQRRSANCGGAGCRDLPEGNRAPDQLVLLVARIIEGVGLKDSNLTEVHHHSIDVHRRLPDGGAATIELTTQGGTHALQSSSNLDCRSNRNGGEAAAQAELQPKAHQWPNLGHAVLGLVRPVFSAVSAARRPVEAR
jgi:hypothetical protein